MIGPVPLLFLVLAAIFAPLSAWFALNRDRSPGVWFILGALAGPLATAILVLGPPGRCPRCGANVTGWPQMCATCGADFPPVTIAALTGRASPAATGRSRPVRVSSYPPAPGASSSSAPTIATTPAVSPAIPPAFSPGVAVAATAAAVEPAAPPAPAATSRSGSSAAGSSSARSGSRLRSGRGRQRAAAATTIQDSGESTELLATAMYVTGSHDCEPGLHYLLTIRGAALVVLGPLETAPHDVASTRPVGDVRVTAFGDGLLITDPRGIRGWSLGFQRFTGGTPESVERALLAAGAGPGVE